VTDQTDGQLHAELREKLCRNGGEGFLTFPAVSLLQAHADRTADVPSLTVLAAHAARFDLRIAARQPQAPLILAGAVEHLCEHSPAPAPLPVNTSLQPSQAEPAMARLLAIAALRVVDVTTADGLAVLGRWPAGWVSVSDRTVERIISTELSQAQAETFWVLAADPPVAGMTVAEVVETARLTCRLPGDPA
jgi:hypothetical protein